VRSHLGRRFFPLHREDAPGAGLTAPCVENVAFEVVFYLDDGRNFSRSRLDAPRLQVPNLTFRFFLAKKFFEVRRNAGCRCRLVSQMWLFSVRKMQLSEEKEDFFTSEKNIYGNLEGRRRIFFFISFL
jgi:hypothetical protein